jgi:DNA-directed RNA polymerase I, II, and III subunit RPABC1
MEYRFHIPIYNTRMEARYLETLKEMLVARGIKSENFEQVGAPMDETRMYTFGGLLVIFSEKTRVTATEFKNFITFASENGYSGGIIIVSPTRPSESILQLVRDHISDKENQIVQIFFQSNLNFNISKNENVPKHRILSQEEIDVVVKEYNIQNLKRIPKIDSQDAMAKWIGARPGDVIEISGLSGSSGEDVRYRYCLANAHETS